MSDDPKDPPSLEEIGKSPVEPSAPGEEQLHGSGMTHRDGPSERARFMEQERDEAWGKWASDHGASDRSKDGADYRNFIESYYELAARGQESSPSLEDVGKSPVEPSGSGRDMGELAAHEPPQAPTLGDLGNLPDPMRGTAPSDDKTVRQIGRDLHRQGVSDPDKDHEPSS